MLLPEFCPRVGKKTKNLPSAISTCPKISEVQVLVNPSATVLSDRELFTGLLLFLSGRNAVDRDAKVLVLTKMSSPFSSSGGACRITVCALPPGPSKNPPEC